MGVKVSRNLDSGVPLTTVSGGFIASAEFQKLYGTNPTNELFVPKLYDNVLQRAPDTGGYNSFLVLVCPLVLTSEMATGKVLCCAREVQAALVQSFLMFVWIKLKTLSIIVPPINVGSRPLARRSVGCLRSHAGAIA
jgi:hypothetical protein